MRWEGRHGRARRSRLDTGTGTGGWPSLLVRLCLISSRAPAWRRDHYCHHGTRGPPSEQLTAVSCGLPRPPGPELLHDLVRLFLADLDELALQVAAFGGNQRGARLPDKIPGERFIAQAASLGVSAPEQAGGPLAAAQLVNDSVVDYLIWHFVLS